MACAIVTNWGNIIKWTTPNQKDISYVEVYRREDDVTASLTTADIVAKIPNVPNSEQAFPFFYDLFTSINTTTQYWYWAKSVAYDGQRSTGPHPTITADRSAIIGLPDGSDTNEPTGFPNRTDSVLSWTDGTRTLSISPSATSFDYYIKGQRFTVTAADTIVPTETTGTTLIYYDSASLTEINSPSDAQVEAAIEEKALVAVLYWNTAQATKILFGDERHGITMDGRTQHYLHDIFGLAYDDGLSLVNFTADQTGADDPDAQFGHNSGAAYDEDIKVTAAAVASTTGLPIWYRSGAGGPWVSTTNAGFSVITAAAGSRLVWNQNVAGTWQLTEVSNNQFVLCHVFFTNNVDNPMIAIVGQADYGNLAAAQTGATTEINSLLLGDLPGPEIRPIGTVIFQTSNAYGNQVNARVRTVAGGGDYIDWRTATIAGSGVAVSDHGSLSGLADDDHTQYVINDGTRGAQSICAGLTIGGDVVVCGVLTTETLNVTAAASIQTTLHVSGAVTFGSTLEVSGIASFNNNVGISGSLTVSTLNVTGSASVQTTLHVSGAATFGSTIAVSGISSFNNNVNISGILTVSTLNVTGAASIQSTLHVSGAVTLGSSLAVSGSSTFSGTVLINNDLTISGNITPGTHETYDIGADTNRFNTIYVNTIYIGTSGNTPSFSSINIFGDEIGLRGSLYPTADKSANLGGAFNRFGSAWSEYFYTADGFTYISGTASGTLRASGNFIPNTTNIFNLGNSTNIWKSLYAGTACLTTLSVSGHSSFGAASSLDARRIINIYENNTTGGAGDSWGAYVLAYKTPSTNLTGKHVGIGGYAQPDNTNFAAGSYCIGLDFGPYAIGGTDGNALLNLIGVNTWGIRGTFATFNANKAVGLVANLGVSDGSFAGICDSLYGIEIPACPSGITANTSYGLFIGTQTQCITNYQVVLSGTDTASDGMWFGGTGGVHIGTGNGGNATKLYINKMTAVASNWDYMVWSTADNTWGINTSSERFKFNIDNYQSRNDWKNILKVDIKQWTDAEKCYHKNIGFIAEDLVRAGMKDLVKYDAKKQVKGIRPYALEMSLLTVAKDQQKKIDNLLKTVDRLSDRLDKLCGKKT